MRAPAAIVEATINAPLETSFRLGVPISIPDIMKAKGVVPGVARIEDQTGPWDAVGRSRRIFLEDDSSVYEELIEYEFGQRFAYRVSEFSPPLSFLVTEARGEWRFEDRAPQITRIVWTYAFTPRSPIAKPLVSLFVNHLWRGYIEAALQRVKIIIEQESTSAL